MKNKGRNLTLIRMRQEDVLAIGGETKDEWYRQVMRVVASQMDYQAQCTIAACRRHKFCCGRISEAQRGVGGYHRLFPPCTNGDEDRRLAIVYRFDRLVADRRARE